MGKSEPLKSHHHLHHSSSMHMDDDVNNADAPIADLFLNCTVLFADISGFTSWSSERSPGQVFVLLETIYGAFDRIADRRGVFKVETIGDCYMAVTGLPNPKKDHALIITKFARDCRDEMISLTKSLEVTLGPDTSDLAMRFGLHFGWHTGGGCTSSSCHTRRRRGLIQRIIGIQPKHVDVMVVPQAQCQHHAFFPH